MTTAITWDTITDIELDDKITVNYTKPHYLANGSSVPGKSKTGIVDYLEDVEHGIVGFEANGAYWFLDIRNDTLESRSSLVDPSTRGLEATGTYQSSE